MGEKLTRISREQRTILQILSVLLFVIGGILFLSVFFAIASGMGRVPDSFEEEGRRMAAAFLRAVAGIVLLSVGGFLAKFAFLKPVSEIVATETAGAVSHSAGAVGRGLASSGFLPKTAQETVRLRCRACGYLDSEDARYCSSCGQAM